MAFNSSFFQVLAFSLLHKIGFYSIADKDPATAVMLKSPTNKELLFAGFFVGGIKYVRNIFFVRFKYNIDLPVFVPLLVFRFFQAISQFGLLGGFTLVAASDRSFRLPWLWLLLPSHLACRRHSSSPCDRYDSPSWSPNAPGAHPWFRHACLFAVSVRVCSGGN